MGKALALGAGGLDNPLKSQRETGLTRALQVGIPFWVLASYRDLLRTGFPEYASPHSTGLMVTLDFKAQPPEMHHLPGSLDRLGNLPSALGLRH